jgi:hypothetical protein
MHEFEGKLALKTNRTLPGNNTTNNTMSDNTGNMTSSAVEDIRTVQDNDIKEIKLIRIGQQALNDRIKKLANSRPVLHGAELTLARRAGQTVRHWLGEALGVIRESRPDLQHPYPEADNARNADIAPTADVPPKADVAAQSFIAATLNRVVRERDEARRERDDLAQWKREACEVEGQWSVQDVGHEIGAQLGEDIRPLILPFIQSLKADFIAMKAENKKLAAENSKLAGELVKAVEAGSKAHSRLEKPNVQVLVVVAHSSSILDFRMAYDVLVDGEEVLSETFRVLPGEVEHAAAKVLLYLLTEGHMEIALNKGNNISECSNDAVLCGTIFHNFSEIFNIRIK